MLDISALLEEIKASPFVESGICAPHSGVISFSDKINIGSQVSGPSGEWKENPGTALASLERERNTKKINAMEKGEIVSINLDLAGKFVESGTEIMRVRHLLSRNEVLQLILKKALFLFNAPEKARYYFIPTVDIKVKNTGPKSITVHDGMDLFIISRMKRETSLRYSGPDGVIYSVYFDSKTNVEVGQPLIGVCQPSQVAQIEEVTMRVQSEWAEQ